MNILPNAKRLLAICLAFILALGLVIASDCPSYALLSLPEGVQQTNSAPRGVIRRGSIETTTVRSPIDYNSLFEIASATYNRAANDLEGQPVEVRAREITDKLRRAIDRPLDLDTLAVEVSRENNVTVVVARDAEYTLPLVLASVTKPDADYRGKPIEALAVEWRDILEAELRRGLTETSGDAILQGLGRSLRLLLRLVVFTAIVAAIKYAIARRQKRLQQRKRSLEVEAATVTAEVQESTSAPQNEAEAEVLTRSRLQFLQGLNQTLSLERRLGFWNFVQWLLFWLLLSAWYIGFSRSLRQVPYLATFSGRALERPAELLAIWFFTGLAVRVSRRLLDRLKVDWQNHDFINLGDAQRRRLRTATIAGAAKGTISVLITVLGILFALQTLDISGASVLAIGSLLALAISFGSQNLVKDLVNGFLILAEDQYAIGDVIDAGGAAGLVENLNLRITQLRGGNGELITLPNSSITQVKNLTRTWSRVNFGIDVAYQTDPEKALAVLKEVSQGLYNDLDWRDKMLESPEVLGLDSLSHSGMTITVLAKTVPLQQWAVGRELRFRIRKALRTNSIEIGVPQQVYIQESSNTANSYHRSAELE